MDCALEKSAFHEGALESCVVVLCEAIASACLEVITVMRSEVGPFVRGSIREPLRQLCDGLMRSESDLARLRSNDVSIISTTSRKFEVPERRTNRHGEELIAEVAVTVGSVQMTVEFMLTHPAHRLLASVIHVSETISIEAEAKACSLLREQVSEEQFKMYQLTGTLIEESTRLPYLYLIRRSFPTLVFSTEDIDGVRHSHFKLALCAHLGAYPAGHFAGTYCPTDDVLAHLLLLRCDEDEFWKSSTVHLATSGLIGL